MKKSTAASGAHVWIYIFPNERLVAFSYICRYFSFVEGLFVLWSVWRSCQLWTKTETEWLVAPFTCLCSWTWLSRRSSPESVSDPDFLLTLPVQTKKFPEYFVRKEQIRVEDERQHCSKVLNNSNETIFLKFLWINLGSSAHQCLEHKSYIF